MEEVDFTIITSLKSLGVDFEGDVKTVAQFDASVVYAGVAACLKRMTGIRCPAQLPSSMSSRYKEANKLAEKLKEIGYSGDEAGESTSQSSSLGYQTILYSSASETRRLFVFLFDKLPREDDQTTSSDDSHASSAVTRLWRDMRSAVASSLEERHASVGKKSLCRFHPSHNRCFFSRDACYFRQNENLFWHQVHCNLQFVPSLLTADCWQNDADIRAVMPSSLQTGVLVCASESTPLHNTVKNELLALQAKFSDVFTSLKSPRIIVPGEQLSSKPSLPPKPSRLKQLSTASDISLIAAQVTADAIQAAADENSIENQCVTLDDELRRLRETTTVLEDLAEKLVDAVETSKVSVAVLEKETSDVEILLQQREKVVLICENLDVGLTSLANSVEKQQIEATRLQDAWCAMEADYAEQKTTLQQQLNHRTEKFAVMQKELQQGFDFQRAAVEEIDTKQRLLKLLRDEAVRQQHQHDVEGRKDSDITSRQFYTKRIADIINNTHKQRKEINRIIGEIRSVQKESNSLAGKRDRALAELDDVVFTRAKVDKWARDIYRNIAALHDACEVMLSKIEGRGTTQRETENTEHQIERLTSKLESSNTERLQHDLDQIKQENIRLVNAS